MIGEKNIFIREGRKSQTRNYIFLRMNVLVTTLPFTKLFFRVSVYWFMHSVINNENEIA